MDFYDREYLLRKEEWVDISEITGEENVLKSSIIEDCFQKIMDSYTPTKKFAIFSLCSHIRPYIRSRKWKMYYDCFSEDCELIICSNGGIIPLEYMNCYPFLEYDAPHTNKFTPLYKMIFKKRLELFLKKFQFEKIIFIFSPKSRNYSCIEEMKISNSVLLPTKEQYDKIMDGMDRYIGVSTDRCSLASDCILCFVEKYFEIHSKYLQELHMKYPDIKKPKMDDIFRTVLGQLQMDRGYTIEEIEDMMLQKSGLFSKTYIRKTILGHTGNIESELKKGNDLYFFNKKFYRVGSKYFDTKKGKLF